MADPKQIPHLIRLLDDDSPVVKAAVVEELTRFGEDLLPAAVEHSRGLSITQIERLNAITEQYKQKNLRSKWTELFSMKEGQQKLETALAFLAEYQSGIQNRKDLGFMLDGLAEEYRRRKQPMTAYKLSRFLFQDKEYHGSEDDYYNPQHSNLIYVIESRKGLPISLSCLFMLTAARLGIHVEGCHIPGHFMTRIRHNEETMLVDCFNGGRVIKEEDVLNIATASRETIQKMLKTPSTPDLIIRRVLNNLIHAYHLKEDQERSVLMADLLVMLNNQIDLSEDEFGDFNESDFNDEPKFRIGQKVRHKRYGYRGLVVDFDTKCYADDEWYKNNATQPDREQPWYHILVHDSIQTTYAAESSLEIDLSEDTINHPFVPYYFTKDKNGRYQRNTKPWTNEDLG